MISRTATVSRSSTLFRYGISATAKRATKKIAKKRIIPNRTNLNKYNKKNINKNENKKTNDTNINKKDKNKMNKNIKEFIDSVDTVNDIVDTKNAIEHIVNKWGKEENVASVSESRNHIDECEICENTYSKIVEGTTLEYAPLIHNTDDKEESSYREETTLKHELFLYDDNKEEKSHRQPEKSSMHF